MIMGIFTGLPWVSLLFKPLSYLGAGERLGLARRTDLQETRAIDKMLDPCIREHSSMKEKHSTPGVMHNYK